MAEEDEEKDYINWYKGQPSTFDPEYGELFTGYKIAPERLGVTTNPSTAEQVGQVAEKLRQGMKTIEMGVLSPQVFETIPKQHFEKIRDLAKLTGAEITIHAPIGDERESMDVVGMGRGGWSESNRQEAERRMINVVEQSHAINPEGNIPISIHATMAHSGEWGEEGKESIAAINPETGESGLVPVRAHPLLKEEERPKTPEEELELINENLWKNQIREVEKLELQNAEFLRRAAEDLNKIDERVRKNAVEKIREGRKEELTNEEINFINENNRLMQTEMKLAEDMNSSLGALFNKAYADEKNKENLDEISNKYNKIMVERNELLEKGDGRAIEKLREAQQLLMNGLAKNQPQTYRPIEEFAKEKASETISQVALHAYDEYEDTAPILAIENIYPNVAFGRGEDLKAVIEESRKKFVEKAVDEGMGKEKAKKQAEKLIGATWDIGHINMLKGKGVKEDTIIKDTKTIAPYIKKVHVTDNFGFADTHLAPGMANVAAKRHLKEMEKGTPGFKKIKTIAELGGLHTGHRVANAYPYALEAMGSSLYAPVMASYWQRPPSRYSLSPEAQGGYFAPITKELGGITQKKQYTTE